MSCNGCRVLRKGCSKDCTIRPCLQWLKNPQHQSNATFFLAKFYGRAGLINLINSGPENLRPAIFRSLLYEACGRIVDPVYGSAGLLCSGSWQLCQAAVEAVLRGAPIPQISPAEGRPTMMNGCDIRHVVRDDQSDAGHRVKPRSRFKRQGPPNQIPDSAAEFAPELGSVRRGAVCVDPCTDPSMFSDGSHLSGGERDGSRAEELELELRLGNEPVTHASGVHGVRHVNGVGEMDGWGDATCNVELGLVRPA